MLGDLKRDTSPSPPTRFWEKIALVAEISAKCRQPKADGSTLSEILELIQEIVPFDTASLYLRDKKQGGFELAAQIGVENSPPHLMNGSDQNPDSEQIADWEPTLAFEDDPNVLGVSSPYAAIMAVPLLVDDRVIGVLNLAALDPDCLESKHVKLMTVVADQLAVSLERLNYVAEIEARNQQLQEAHEKLRGMQQKVIAAEKLQAVAELAASINHEINNPLAVILGHTQLLQISLPKDFVKERDRLKLIEQAAIRIGEINRKVLKIDSLVTEDYIRGAGTRILNLEKSTTG